MMIVDRALEARERAGNPIQTAVVGAGEMAKGIVNQLHRYTPGVRVAVVYNRTLDRAREAMTVAGIESYRVVDTSEALEAAIRDGVPALTGDLDVLFGAESLDLLLESTGAVDFGARLVLRCADEGKHVLTFNAELDSTLGPLLAHRARRAGVKYSIAEGDQPGCTLNLYREVAFRGFEPLVCINVKGMLDRYRTPATQEKFAASWGMNPVMATNFADGTKVNCEQASIANAVGFRVNTRGMNAFDQPGKHVDELTGLYDVDELRAHGGIVDFIIGAKPGPGVAVFAAARDPFTEKYLKYGKLGDGPLYSFYIPYHLLFFEIGSSVGRFVDFDDLIIAPTDAPRVEVVSYAKKDLQAGERLDGIGGYALYGLCENYGAARAEDLLPIGLADGVRVNRDVAKDRPLTFADVTFEDPYLRDLYEEQRRLFPAPAVVAA